MLWVSDLDPGRNEQAQITDPSSQASLIDLCIELKSKHYRLQGHTFWLTGPGWMWFLLNGLLGLIGEDPPPFFFHHQGGAIKGPPWYTQTLLCSITSFPYKCHRLLVMEAAGFPHQLLFLSTYKFPQSQSERSKIPSLGLHVQLSAPVVLPLLRNGILSNFKEQEQKYPQMMAQLTYQTAHMSPSLL